MASGWNGTKFPGVRYREHPTRKHGVQKDKYFAIRAQVNGKRKEEGLGWASEGWTAQKAANELAQLKKAHVLGEGPQTLQEKRELVDERREAERKERELREQESITFKEFFEKTYFPQAKADKSKRSFQREDSLFRFWIQPVIGNSPLCRISPIDLERIKKKMADKGKSPRSIHYCLAVIRQVFNQAKRLGVCQVENPVSKVKKPTSDNRRLRFLSHSEADSLLKGLKNISEQVYEMALVSLHCGLRAGEVFSLTWGDVDLDNGSLTLRDTKSGRNRTVFVTKNVREILEDKERREPSSLVFPARSRKGIEAASGSEKRIEAISKTFDRVVNDLKLNAGITDARQRVCFHTLRHTHASWLVAQGVDLYVVQKILGHSDMAMTQRYSHLAPDTLQRATRVFENGLKQAKENGKNAEEAIS
ncbi:MAG: tyrosine-type recombinase/integrase [Syntrophobacteraceae bacterium]